MQHLTCRHAVSLYSPAAAVQTILVMVACLNLSMTRVAVTCMARMHGHVSTATPNSTVHAALPTPAAALAPARGEVLRPDAGSTGEDILGVRLTSLHVTWEMSFEFTLWPFDYRDIRVVAGTWKLKVNS